MTLGPEPPVADADVGDVAAVPSRAQSRTQSRTQSIFSAEYRLLTVGIIAVMTIAAFEAMGVITAMPTAAHALNGLNLYAWGSTAFAAVSLFAMAAAGGWADRVGPLRPLGAGLGVFLVGTLVCGFSPSMPVLLLGRCLQGFGFGGVIVALYVVIGRAYPEDLRPRVFTALSGAWIVPGIAGPLVAGAITDTWGWRWVFFAILALLVPVAVVLLPRLQHLHIAPDADAKPTPGRKRLALMAAVGVALVQVAMQRADVLGLGLGILGVLLLGTSLPQLLPEGTLRLRRGLPTVVMLRGLFAGAFFGAEWFIPLLLVSERGLASSQAGGSLSGAAVGWFVGSWVQGRPTLRASRERMVVIGSLFTTVGLALSTVVTFQAVPWWTVALTWSIGSFGMGILYGSLGVLVLQFSPPAEQGVNSAALQMADSLGVILATGLGGAIFAAGHVSSGADDAVYRTIFLVMSAIAILATAISPRVATQSVISAARR